MAGKSKILIVGAAGHIGKFIVEASIEAGHQTYLLLRESTLSNPEKSDNIKHFKSLGVHIVLGDLEDYERLVKAIKEVDVVISTVGHAGINDQFKLLAAIKEAGNLKRFLPSEFGNDVDRMEGSVEPAKGLYAAKAKLRRAVEAAGIPHTVVSANFFNFYFLTALCQPGLTSPPAHKAVVFGDPNVKGIFNYEEDIAKFTIRAVDDPRTLNKILYIRPPSNFYSQNQLISLWENKIGKSIERVCLSEEQLLKNIQEAPGPLLNLTLSVLHSVFVKGGQTNFEIESSFGVEATELYPDIKYTTVDEYLHQFL